MKIKIIKTPSGESKKMMESVLGLVFSAKPCIVNIPRDRGVTRRVGFSVLVREIVQKLEKGGNEEAANLWARWAVREEPTEVFFHESICKQ
jgi:hypothetical protein